MVGGVPRWLLLTNEFFTPFRMPTLMLMSGMLLSRSMSKSLGRFYSGKLRGIVWPYVVWVLVYFWIITGVWGESGPSGVDDWIATSWLWYVFCLGVYYLVAPVTRFIPAWVIALGCWAGSFFVNDETYHRMLYFGALFFIGHLIWEHRDRLRRYATTPLMIVCALTAVAVGLLHVNRFLRFLDPAAYLPLSLIGVAAAIMAARRLQPDALPWLQWIGRN